MELRFNSSLDLDNEPSVQLNCWIRTASSLIGVVSIPVSHGLFFTSC